MLLALAPLAVIAASPQYDVIIRHGRLLDGSGSPWRYADVAFKGDRIAAVGQIPAGATAGRVLDASGEYVAPGFIDTHSHAAPGIETEALAAAVPILLQGITTVLINPDGGGPSDLKPQISALESHGPGVNVVLQIGHNAVREAVMGLASRKPTAAEQQRMEKLVREAMQEGAAGLSSGPFYVPGKYSDTAELIGLAKVAAGFPGAWYASHIRDESNYSVGLLAAVDEVIEIARQAHLPGIVDHVKALGPAVWGQSRDVIAHIEAARSAGVEVWANQYPYTASGSSLTAALVPGWAQEGGEAALVKRLEDERLRAQIRDEMAQNLARRAGAGAIMIGRYAPQPELEGRRLDAIARQRSEDALDTAIDLLRHGGASIVSFNMDDQDVDAFMRQPWTMTCTDGALVAFGEGAEHPRAYGGFPRKIRLYVVERHVITLEAAIHSMTALPAAVYRLPDRGEIRQGAFADVVVFDPKNVLDAATYEKPHAYSKGMDHVFVNGREAATSGQVASHRYGRVLLRPRSGG
jgi:N-acyl-D-amino-acid deacylase